VTACTGRGSGVAATNTGRSWCTRPTLTTWFPAWRVGAAGSSG